jgi:hypothetical protein
MPKQKGEIKLIVPIAIALAVLFIIASTVILPFFKDAFEFGFGNAPCSRDGCTASSSLASRLNPYCVSAGSDITCSNCNATSGYKTFLDKCYKLSLANISGTGANEADSWANNTYCVSCANFGFKSVSTGLLLLILVIGMIFFAVTFLKATKLGK